MYGSYGRSPVLAIAKLLISSRSVVAGDGSRFQSLVVGVAKIEEVVCELKGDEVRYMRIV
jgi:hypothetical protein